LTGSENKKATTDNSVLLMHCFTAVYIYTGSLSTAKNILALPLLYSLVIIPSLIKAVSINIKTIQYPEIPGRSSYNAFQHCSLMALPVVIFFNLSQALEVSITNTGFLMLMGMQIKQYIDQTRAEHLKLVNWNTTLQKEVDKRTQELKKVNDQKTTAFINVAHEIKTPLTLINNYLDDYIGSQTESEELTAVKKNIESLINT
jgi:signal transduction histidine kinase